MRVGGLGRSTDALSVGKTLLARIDSRMIQNRASHAKYRLLLLLFNRHKDTFVVFESDFQSIPIGTGNDLMDRIYENALSAYVYTTYKLKLNYSDERNENAFLAANKIASQGRFLTERDVAPFLGDMYLKGVGCEVDYDKAYYYCKLTNMNVEGLFITNPFTKKKDIPRTIKMRLQAEGYHKVK